MISVFPMPNELDAGHRGRIQWINGCRGESELMSLIRGALVERGFDPTGMSHLNQQAIISEMDCRDYARRHSILANARVAASGGNEAYGGERRPPHHRKRSGMAIERTVAFCCPQCIVEDLHQVCFSWYRRYHHLFGVDWCAVHGAKLSVVEDTMPFVCPPHVWLSRNKLKPQEGALEEMPSGGFLRRFSDISVMLLDRRHPFPMSSIHGALAHRAAYIVLRPTRDGGFFYRARPLISDHLSGQVRTVWLQEHVPDWRKKHPFSYFHQIDAVAVVTRRTAAGPAYIMAMAALYETAGAAMQDVSLSEAQDKYPSSDSHGTIDKWHRKFIREYTRCYDELADFSGRFGLHPLDMEKILASFGLPNLYEHEPSDQWAALVRFCSGERLCAACIAEQVEKEEVKALLRRCGGHVMQTIRILRKDFLQLQIPQRERRSCHVFISGHPV